MLFVQGVFPPPSTWILVLDGFRTFVALRWEGWGVTLSAGGIDQTVSIGDTGNKGLLLLK